MNQTQTQVQINAYKKVFNGSPRTTSNWSSYNPSKPTQAASVLTMTNNSRFSSAMEVAQIVGNTPTTIKCTNKNKFHKKSLSQLPKQIACDVKKLEEDLPSIVDNSPYQTQNFRKATSPAKKYTLKKFYDELNSQEFLIHGRLQTSPTKPKD